MKMPRMSTTPRLAAAAVAVALASGATLATAAPAAASTPVPVTIQDTVIIGPFTGTWSASGGISDSGTLTQPVDFRVGVGAGGFGQVHAVRVMT